LHIGLFNRGELQGRHVNLARQLFAALDSADQVLIQCETLLKQHEDEAKLASVASFKA
jgi:hypothetical protein